MTAAKKPAKKTSRNLPRPRRQKLIPDPETALPRIAGVEKKSPDKKVKPVSPTTKKPLPLAASMEELMARKESKFFVPRRGEIIRGTVTDVTNRIVLLDIGAKTEGMVMDRDYDEARDYIKTLSAGDEVSAYVLTPENDRGQILLSLRGAANEWKWKKVLEWQRTGEVIPVRGLEVNKGGLVARIDQLDLQGFIPASQLGGKLASTMDDLINRVLSARVIEVDRDNNRLIFSERSVSEAGEIEAQKEALKSVKPGQKIKGTIVGLADFGAFSRVKIGGHELEGLIHISELAWEKVDKASDVVSEGQEVEMVVVDVNPDAGKIGFSLKRLQTDPWEEIEERYPPGKKVTGKVVKVASFGIFAQLEPGVTGLLHISKVPTDKEPAVGDEIEVMVADLDASHRRLSLDLVLGEIPVMYR